MKKLSVIVLILALALLLAVPAAATGIDLSALSWDELIALKAEIGKEQMSRDEWQEVEVPQGVWVVGEDIPAGKWTVRCTTGRATMVSWGEKLTENGEDIESWGYLSGWGTAYNPDARSYDDGDPTEYTFEAQNGHYIVIEYSSATFSPYTGKPDLGFKK